MEYGDDYSRAQLAMESLTKFYPASKNYSPDYSKKVFGSKPFTFAVLDVYTPRDQPFGPTEVEPGMLAPSASGRSARAGSSSAGRDSWEEHLRTLPTRTKSQLKQTTSSSSSKSASSGSPEASTSTTNARSSSREELLNPVATNGPDGHQRHHARGLRTTFVFFFVSQESV